MPRPYRNRRDVEVTAPAGYVLASCGPVEAPCGKPTSTEALRGLCGLDQMAGAVVVPSGQGSLLQVGPRSAPSGPKLFTRRPHVLFLREGDKVTFSVVSALLHPFVPIEGHHEAPRAIPATGPLPFPGKLADHAPEGFDPEAHSPLRERP